MLVCYQFTYFFFQWLTHVELKNHQHKIASLFWFRCLVTNYRLIIITHPSTTNINMVIICIIIGLTYVCMYVCLYVYMYVQTCMYVCIHVCMYVCMYACMYVCTYVCIYIYVCIYVCM